MRRLTAALFSALLIIGLFSCQKEEVFESKRFVRVEPNSVTISIGEDFRVIPVFDSEETAKGSLHGHFDPTVAMFVSNTRSFLCCYRA